MIYSFEYPVRSFTGVPFRQAIITSDGLHMVLCAADKTNRDCILTHNALTGQFEHKISLKQSGIKDCSGLIAMPHKGHLVAVMTPDKGSIFDIKNKKYLRSIPKWGGMVTKDGKYGLYAPQR